MQMIQKLIDSPDNCVEDAIKGALLADSRIVRVEGFNILVRSDYGMLLYYDIFILYILLNDIIISIYYKVLICIIIIFQ